MSLEKKVLITISTYQKTDALDYLLKSLYRYGYMENNKIVVCDDNAGNDYYITQKDNPNHPHWTEIKEIHGDFWPTDEEEEDRKAGRQKVLSPARHIANMASFKPIFKEVEVICGKERGGVAINKNRGIKYFLEHPEFDELLMLDDDIVFTGPGLLDKIRAAGLPHMTGFLGSKDDPDGSKVAFGETSNPFFVTFPPKGEREHHYYCEGSQGMMLWTERAVVEEIGYFDLLPDKYGFEHSLWSNRIISAYEHKYLDWFPVLKDCGKFFQSQAIPNNYAADYVKNEKAWRKRKPEILNGTDLRKKNGGV